MSKVVLSTGAYCIPMMVVLNTEKVEEKKYCYPKFTPLVINSTGLRRKFRVDFQLFRRTILPTWIINQLVSIRLKRIWLSRSRYCHFCSVQDPDSSIPIPIWYLWDEFGSSIQHGSPPNVIMRPFYYADRQISYTVMWPTHDIGAGGTHCNGAWLWRTFLDFVSFFFKNILWILLFFFDWYNGSNNGEMFIGAQLRP